ncbi:MAG: hypothetical protein ACKVQB_11655 [Bacteroidia bacterium]
MISFCISAQSKLSITEYDTIEDVAHVWDILLPSTHSLRSPNLRVLEVAKPDSMIFKYLMVKKNDVLIGAVYLQHLKITTNHFNGTSIDKPGLGWLKKCVNSRFSDVLICGNLFRIHFPSFYFKNPKHDELIFEILNDYLNSDKSNQRFCGILLKDCEYPFIKTEKFKPYHDDVTMEIEIRPEWVSFEEYKKSLSKKYKQRCNKILKSGEILSIKELSIEVIFENALQIEKLYLNVALKQSLRIGFVNAAYFIEMKRRHGHSFIFKGYYLNEQLVAFSSHILYENNTMEIHFIGLDYHFNESHSLYFNILFDGLKMAIDKKIKRLELGRTARIAKASIGAQPVEVYNYIFLRKGIPSLAFYFFNNWFVKNMGEDWKQRNPFKILPIIPIPVESENSFGSHQP